MWTMLSKSTIDVLNSRMKSKLSRYSLQERTRVAIMNSQDIEMNLNRLRSISNSEMWSNMVTRDSLLQLYNERVSGGDNYDAYAAEFVDIFGGIHQIIETHLRCPDIILTYTQLDRIEQILSSDIANGHNRHISGHSNGMNGYHGTVSNPKEKSQRVGLSSLDVLSRMNRSLSTKHVDQEEALMTYVFDPDDRWLSDRLVKIVFHDYAFTAFVLTKIIYYVIFLVDASNVYTIFYNFFCRCFFYIPWFLMAIMSTNRETRKLLYHSFGVLTVCCCLSPLSFSLHVICRWNRFLGTLGPNELFLVSCFC